MEYMLELQSCEQSDQCGRFHDSLRRSKEFMLTVGNPEREYFPESTGMPSAVELHISLVAAA
jgi:hypothetical protein